MLFEQNAKENGKKATDQIVLSMLKNADWSEASLIAAITPQAHGVVMTSDRRWCDVMTSRMNPGSSVG